MRKRSPAARRLRSGEPLQLERVLVVQDKRDREFSFPCSSLQRPVSHELKQWAKSRMIRKVLTSEHWNMSVAHPLVAGQPFDPITIK